MSKITSITDKIFDDVVERDVSGNPILVEFYDDWCGPCQDFAPILEEYAGKHPEIQFYKINISENPRVADEHGITSVPTTMLVKQGKGVLLLGTFSQKSLEKAVKTGLAKIDQQLEQKKAKPAKGMKP